MKLQRRSNYFSNLHILTSKFNMYTQLLEILFQYSVISMKLRKRSNYFFDRVDSVKYLNNTRCETKNPLIPL